MAKAKNDRWTLVFDGEGNLLHVEKNGERVAASSYPLRDVTTIEMTYAIEVIRYRTKEGDLAVRYHHPDCRSFP